MSAGSETVRFAVLTHDHPAPHFDLLIEAGDVCRTWRLDVLPLDSPAATPIADHRTHYLTYEGPVSGDRGTVARWDAGLCRVVEETGDGLRVDFQGRRLQGLFAIGRTLQRVCDSAAD